MVFKHLSHKVMIHIMVFWPVHNVVQHRATNILDNILSASSKIAKTRPQRSQSTRWYQIPTAT